MTNINLQYYQANAQDFYDATVDINMQALHQKFLPLVSSGGLILDAGCGAGRDSKAFLNAGFNVQAFDASEKLARLASTHIKQSVQHATFDTFQADRHYDGIWACASLLHVPMLELKGVLEKLISMLSDNGVFYCSFKLGNEEVTRNGRVFTNLNEESFGYYIHGLPVVISEQWITGDLRDGREGEQWLNVILRKSASE